MIFETERLKIRKAETSDVDFYLSLWNNKNVMKFVGWKNGLQITDEEVEKLIRSFDKSEYNQTLVVVEKQSGKRVGECKLGLPKEDHIAFTDVKLLPEFWGNGYGVEIKNALCHYLFTHTDAKAVKADPNIKNTASQKMQIACGGVEVDRGIWRVPPERKHICEDVPFIVYHIYRDAWLEKNMKIEKIAKSDEKSRICKRIIESLPAWFGIPEANEEYVQGVAETDFYTAYMFEKEVGFFSIISHFKETSEIYVCGVKPDFHRLGIGRKLLNASVEDLKKMKKKFLTVKTLSSSHPDKGYACTREFYKKCGFVPVEEFKTLWGEANPCLFLVKNI